MSSPIDVIASPLAVAFFSAIRASSLERLSSLTDLSAVADGNPSLEDDVASDPGCSSTTPRGPGGRAA